MLLMMEAASARVMGSSGRKLPLVSPAIHPAAAARPISTAAQWPAVSLKLPPATPWTSSLRKRTAITANSARVMLRLGRKAPSA